MKSKILLIVETNKLRKNTTDILELANYQVYTAVNGKEGVEEALKIKPDLIISDVPISKIDGYGVLQILRKKKEFNLTPFIFMSAKTKHSDVRKGMELGASDYITVPFDKSELLSAVEIRLKLAKEHKAMYNSDIDATDVTELYYLDEIFKNKKKYYYKKGASIYCEGNSSNHIFYLIKGKVKTFENNELGKEFITSIFSTKRLFGFTSLLKSKTYHENAVTIDESKILKISRVELLNLFRKNSQLSINVIDLLVDKLENLKSHLIHLAYDSVRKKTAETLYKLYADGGSEIIEISRTNLAGLVGIAKETLIRTLTDLKEEDIIRTNRKSIKIINSVKLKRIQ